MFVKGREYAGVPCGLFRRGFAGLLACLAVCGAVFLEGCGEREPLEVGFAAPLSGTLSDYGLSNRRGVVLAVEEINARGGVKGRNLELVVKDDANDPATAARVDRELIAEDVVAIVGHFSSTATWAGYPVVEAAGVLMISPAASTEKLEGRDDGFLRMVNSHTEYGRKIADYARDVLKLEKTGVFYDLANPDCVSGYAGAFKERFAASGGGHCGDYAFDAREKTDVGELAEKAVADGCDGVLMIANAVDAASFSQQIKLLKPDVRLMSSAWAQKDAFIENGGQAVEGVVFVSPLGMVESYAPLDDFKKRFKERFGTEADLSAVLGYEAMKVLIGGLERADELTTEAVKGAILSRGMQPGLDGDFSMDEYGDPCRSVELYTVKDGAFTKIDSE